MPHPSLHRHPPITCIFKIPRIGAKNPLTRYMNLCTLYVGFGDKKGAQPARVAGLIAGRQSRRLTNCHEWSSYALRQFNCTTTQADSGAFVSRLSNRHPAAGGFFSRRWTPPSATNSGISGRQRHRFHTLSSPFSPLNSRRKSFAAVQRAMQFRPAKLHVPPTTSGTRIAGGTLRTRRSTFDRRAPSRQESCRSTART